MEQLFNAPVLAVVPVDYMMYYAWDSVATVINLSP